MIPAVSILMPIHNEAGYLAASLRSITSQTFMAWELVAVDDGSTDDTPALLAAAAAQDSRIRVIRREGGGLVAALNAGLEQCRAPLVARMDGDDINHPRRLELQTAYLESRGEVGLVATGFRHFPRQSLKQGMCAYEEWQNGLTDHATIMRDLYVESPFVHPSVMVRRQILLDAGGYRDCGWAEDYDLWLRLAHAGNIFARINKPLFFWRDHPERVTRTSPEYSQDAFRHCKMHHLLRGILQDRREVAIAGAGLEGRAWQRLLAEAGITVSAWIDVDPRKVGSTLHGAPVLGTDRIGLLDNLLLVAIGVRGARAQFRELAGQLGRKEGLDYICVA